MGLMPAWVSMVMQLTYLGADVFIASPIVGICLRHAGHNPVRQRAKRSGPAQGIIQQRGQAVAVGVVEPSLPVHCPRPVYQLTNLGRRGWQ
jgi:hypothetical protein